MKYQLDIYHRNTPEKELLYDLKRVAEHLQKRSLSNQEYREHGNYGVNTYVRRFGSWNAAIVKAGLVPTRKVNHSDEDYLENIEHVWIKLGRQPRWGELKRPLSRFTGGAYQKRFGGWRKALDLFIEYVNNEDSNTKPQSSYTASSNKTAKRKGRRTRREANWRLRFLVMRRDRFKCVACGRSPSADHGVILHVDHIKPWAKSGETIFSNLQTLCSKCNIGKSDLSFDFS